MENVFFSQFTFCFWQSMTLYFLHFGKPFFPCFSSPQNELGKWIRPWGAWWWSQFSWAIWRVVLFLSGIQFQNWPGAWFHEEQLHPDFQWNFPPPWLNHWQADDDRDDRCQSVAESDTDRSIGRIWCCLLDCLWILSRAGTGLLTILLQGFHLCWGKKTLKSWKFCESCQASQSSKPRKLHNNVIWRRHQEAIHTNLLCITVHVYKIVYYTTYVIYIYHVQIRYDVPTEVG